MLVFCVFCSPSPRSLPLRAGHYPQVVPLDTAAVWSEWENRCLAVPKGQTRIAQPSVSTLGFRAGRKRVPSGTTEGVLLMACFLAHLQGSDAFVGRCPRDDSLGYYRSSLRDSWPGGRFPGVKTPGYSQDVPPGQGTFPSSLATEKHKLNSCCPRNRGNRLTLLW